MCTVLNQGNDLVVSESWERDYSDSLVVGGTCRCLLNRKTNGL